MKLAVLILEDEPEVRQAIERDLLELVPTVRLEPAEDVEDARVAIADIQRSGDVLALALCDHRMPGTTGVEFMVEMAGDKKTADTRKVLLTGQADLEDTVKAVNEAKLHRYIAKPWDKEQLLDVVRDQLTDFVEVRGMNPFPFMEVLDQDRAFDIASRNLDFTDYQ